MRYLKDNFIREAIPLIPLHLLDTGKLGNLLYVLKLIRISRGFELLNVHRIVKHIRNFYKDYTLKLIKDDPNRLLNLALDNNKM